MNEYFKVRNKALYISFILTTFLIFFRAKWALGPGGFDESCYLEYTHKLVGLNYPICYSHSHFPGIAILWAPFAILGWIISAITSSQPSDWIIPLTGLSSFLFWALGIYLIALIQESYFPKFQANEKSKWWPIIFALSVPVLSYAVRDSHMVHAEEFFLSVLGVLLILRKQWLLAALIVLVLTSVRINDAPMFLILLGAIWDDRAALKVQFPKYYRTFWGVVGVTGFLLLFVIIWVGFVKGYHNIFLTDILLKINWEGVFLVLFSKNLGMVWYTPAYLVTVIIIISHRRQLKGVDVGGALWILSVLVFHLGHAVWWGGEPLQIRYLIGSYAAIGLIQLRLWDILSRTEKLFLLWATVFGAISLSLYNFVGADSNMARFILDGNLWSMAPYYAHDGTAIPVGLRKLLLEPLASSPIGFSLFSLAANIEEWPYFQSYRMYALRGPSLVVLLLSSITSVTYLFLISKKRKVGTHFAPKEVNDCEGGVNGPNC